MVQTRRQYNRWVEDRGVDYQSTQESCEDCSQRSQYSDNNDNGFDFERSQETDMGPNGPSYRPNDQCKRHRKQDGEPKTEEVVTYRRRKAIR